MLSLPLLRVTLFTPKFNSVIDLTLTSSAEHRKTAIEGGQKNLSFLPYNMSLQS